jgi:hypothetical protein
MRTLIKLLIVGLIVNATYHVSSAYWQFYEFKDALRDIAQSGERQSDQELQGRAADVASDLDIPIGRHQIAVQRDRRHTGITASYRRDIEIFPNYLHPWEFTADVSTLTFAAAGEVRTVPR